MESPDRKKQKVLKAKKTMSTSCRKQLEILNKLKNVEPPKPTFETNIPNGHNQKKMFSENKENVKAVKTSEQNNENACVALERHTALLEQVKHWIRQEVYMISYNLFDKKLNELNERIGKTQCRNKHEAIADQLFVKIRRLQRHIKKVLSYQENGLESNTLPNNTVCEVTDSEVVNMNMSVAQEPDLTLSKRMSSVNHTPFNSSEKTRGRIDLPSACVEFVSESNTDDVMLISVETPTTPITSGPTVTGKKTSRNSSNSPNTIIEVGAAEKKLDFVIDLTREGLSNYSRGPASSRFHRLPIVSSGEDQAFNTEAFAGHSRSRLQRRGTNPSTRRKKFPVKGNRNPSGRVHLLEEDQSAAVGCRSEVLQELD